MAGEDRASDGEDGPLRVPTEAERAARASVLGAVLGLVLAALARRHRRSGEGEDAPRGRRR